MHNVPFSNRFKTDMLQLQRRFIDDLASHIRSLQDLRPQCASGLAPQDKIISFYHVIHNLSGAGIIFGFPEVSTAARSLVATFQPLLEAEPLPAASRAGSLADLAPAIDEFVSACLPVVEGRETEAANRLILPAAPAIALHNESKDVHLIARNYEETEAMVAKLNQFGYHPVLVEDEATLTQALRETRVRAIIVYSSLPDSDAATLRGLLSAARNAQSAPCLLIVSDKDDFSTRLAAARLGTDGFFFGTKETPPDILKVVERIENVSEKTAPAAPMHVAIIDDDEVLASFYQNTLAQAGIEATVIAQPSLALGILQSQETDLTLIDSTMPECSGMELAAIIRQHDALRGMPLMIMASQDDAEATVARDPGLGMDDFLIKPFSPAHLLSVVRTRMRRLTEIKAFIAHDYFTGLLTQEQFGEHLARELLRVKRHHARTCYAVIDIDNFKAINTDHGHIAGDRIIKILSRMLQQHLRKSDIVGRSGGQRFSILMPGCDPENAARIVENLRARFTDQFYDIGGTKVRVTFSAGLTPLKSAMTLEQAVNAAEKALHTAKQQGRNRIVAA